MDDEDDDTGANWELPTDKDYDAIYSKKTTKRHQAEMERLTKFEDKIRTSKMAYQATGGAIGTSRSGKPIELFVPAQHENLRPNKRMRLQRWIKYQENNPGAPMPTLEESPDVEMAEDEEKGPGSSESRSPPTLAQSITKDKQEAVERGGYGDEDESPTTTATAKTRTRSRSSKIHERRAKGQSEQEKGQGTARDRERRKRSKSNKSIRDRGSQWSVLGGRRQQSDEPSDGGGLTRYPAAGTRTAANATSQPPTPRPSWRASGG